MNDNVTADSRVEALIREMTLDEKIAQLYGVWVGASGEGAEVAPHQHDMEEPPSLDELLPDGLGQLTRPFGTVPVDPALGALSLMRTQERIAAANRFGIPAMAHEECLAGFAAWGATTYPVPLSWGASFDPGLVRMMAAAIGRDMRSVGVHQGLAPVLDVVRDARWGRVEETVGEDPYLVGTIATAYIQGLESAGIVATLKHFMRLLRLPCRAQPGAGQHGSARACRRRPAPFEMAVRESGVRSVMHAYTDTDGVPSAADEELLTGLLRDTWGFDGTVVADYFGIAFLKTLHGVAADWADAAGTALHAACGRGAPHRQDLRAAAPGRRRRGPGRREARGPRAAPRPDPEGAARPARPRVEPGAVRARRGRPHRPAGPARHGRPELRRPQGPVTAPRRAVRRPAEQRRHPAPGAARPHRAHRAPGGDPDRGAGLLLLPGARRRAAPRHPGSTSTCPPCARPWWRSSPARRSSPSCGCGIDDGDVSGIATAVRAALDADVVVAALGDRAGLFGRGTSGEGCDAESLTLPGVQQRLLDALLDTGTPVVLTLLAGRPYALGRAVEEAAAVVQTFFPGQEGTPALAEVLSGRINPSGRLPVSVPRHPGVQPSTYLAAPLARASEVSNIDPAAAFGFGHGLTYTSFEWSAPQVHGASDGRAVTGTDGELELSFTVRNTGARAGSEVVQVYLHDPIASVVQPVQRLVGYLRVPLEAGEARRIDVTVPADVAAFTGRDGRRVVEPGELEVRLAASSTDVRFSVRAELTGPARQVDHTRRLHALVTGAPEESR